MKSILTIAFGLILVIVIALNWIPLLIWFFPLTALFVFFVVFKPSWSSERFLLIISTAAIITGVWAFLLLHFVKKYWIGGLTGGEALGYSYLVSIGGFSFLGIYACIFIASRISQSRIIRIWTLRSLIIATLGISTFILYHIDIELCYLFATISFLSGIWFIIKPVDPLEQIRNWRNNN